MRDQAFGTTGSQLSAHALGALGSAGVARLRNARAKGKKLGRPRVIVDAARIARLRASGASWPKIAAELGVSVGTVYQAAQGLSKIPSGSSPAPIDS
jgi:Homeodomain-like domain-containing protein